MSEKGMFPREQRPIGSLIGKEASNPPRILVAEDDRNILEMNCAVLIRAGYEVDTACDGAEAWKALHGKHYDLIVTDNLMPKMTGVELINKLHTEHISIQVIMATGTLPNYETVRNPWLKAIVVVNKPYSSSELLSAVKEVLGKLQYFQDRSSDPDKVEKAEARMSRAEQRLDRAEARSDKAEDRLDRTEAKQGRADAEGDWALRFSELRYRRLFEAAQDGIIILDFETGRISDVNPFLEKLLGFSHSEMFGRTVAELSPFKDIEPNKDMLRRLQEHGYVRYEDLPLETRENRHIDVEFVCNVYQEGDQKVIQCNIRDITERKIAEEEKRRFNSELEKRVFDRTEELEAFSFSVSHDLRVPLRHVIGFVRSLREDAGLSASEKSLLLTKITTTTKRMEDLIGDLLAFSRTALSEMHKENVDLDELVDDTLSDFRVETEERQIEWKVQPLPTVKADRALLRLVFVNLISNAVKFTGASSYPKVEIVCNSSGTSEVIISIRDNGAGFDPEYAHKLFGVFQRLHSHEEFEGTGLGLANIRRIIRRHGGRVWAEGIVNVGATFYFSLPK